MKLRVLGSGDAFHGGARGHCALLLEDAHGRLLVDCGGTTLHALAQAGVSPNDVQEVLLTHLHGDHFAGVPFLLLAGMYDGPRTAPLVIAGPIHTEARVEALFRLLYSSSSKRQRPFAFRYQELEAGRAIDLGGRRIVSQRAAHMSPPDVALSYRIESEGRIVAVSGDTGPEAELATLADGADLFVCECTRGPGEADEDHLGVDDVVRLRSSWNAKRVVLTHLSAASRAAARTIAGVEIAEDGATYELAAV